MESDSFDAAVKRPRRNDGKSEGAAASANGVSQSDGLPVRQHILAATRLAIRRKGKLGE